MSLFKTILGVAAGAVALYAVGKTCYELGKEVNEIQHQLEESKKAQKKEPQQEDNIKEETHPETEEKSTEEASEEEDKEEEEEQHEGIVSKIKNKVQTVTSFLKLRKTLKEGGGANKRPSVLGTLLKNPEGTRIEAFVTGDGVHIDVKPKAA